MFEIEYYKKSNGDIPVKHFIDDLEIKMQSKVLRQIMLLKEYGPELGEPFSKQLVRGLFELRIKQSSNITRILYFFIRDRKIILTNGFTKKSPKTPVSEIERAKRYQAEYENRGPNTRG